MLAVVLRSSAAAWQFVRRAPPLTGLRGEDRARAACWRPWSSRSMAKKPAKDAALRHVRSKEKRACRETSGPSSVYLQVVAAGNRENGSAKIFLYTFQYFFYIAKNIVIASTLKCLFDHRLKTATLDNIFLTRMNWQTVGGLSGMILTLRESGVPGCILSGPPQLVHTPHILSLSVYLFLSVRTYTDPDFTDGTMTVTQVPIFAEIKEDRVRRSSSPSGSTSSSQRKELWKAECVESSADGQLSRSPSPGTANCLSVLQRYSLTLGTAAIGPFIAALKDGKSVTYNGKEIHPSEVCTPSDPGARFLVIDCPSEEFVQPLCTNDILKRYQSEEDGAILVVHMTPESVLKTEEYQHWMERFPSSTEHLIMNEQVHSVHNVRSQKIQTQLNLIHTEVFPQLQKFTSPESQAALHVPNVRAECLLKFQFRPKVEWQRDPIPVCDEEEFVKEAAEVPDFLQEVEEFKRFQATDPVDRYPEVVFLGTGSAVPMKTRNVSGTLVNISSSQSLILDCGEGTFGQLCHHYGNDVDEMLTKLSTVFISHLHADHHTGLINLLLQRERALNSLGKSFTPICLVAPTSIMTWLNQYHDHCQRILSHINYIPAKLLSEGVEVPKFKTKSFIQDLLKRNDLTKFQTCLVKHCKNAFACSLTHQSGWQLVFSGDTMPCDELVQMGKNATLLIHEATLEDGMEEDAREKRHSTTSQAIDIGMKMNAEFTVLNHFSQRYATIPLFSDDFNQRLGISFDHMRIRLGDFRILPRLLAPLKALFAEKIEEMEEKREKREMKVGRTMAAISNSEAAEGGGAKREQEEPNQEIAAKRLKAS
uniref:Zinc phosphodiesterase ELAC protein 2 n=1 Tax=Astyanax mexicanus TaxID=7994 RepID=A0A3B1JZC8_ASTMX